MSKLGGVSITAKSSRIYSETESWHNNLSNLYSSAPSLNHSFVKHSPTPLINRKMRQKLSKEINSASFLTLVKGNDTNKAVIELKRHSARPAGCSFLGARATETLASLDDPEGELILIIVDSGSDITLISEKALERMTVQPKIRTGQRINLIQVTGNMVITGYVTLNLYFETEEGPVLIRVKAYVVKGMSTPFILGNDFTDQYSISLLREKGESTLVFGQSGRSKKVHNSLTSTFIDEDGHAFKVCARPDITAKALKARIHRKSQKLKRRSTKRSTDNHVRTNHVVLIGPESTKLVRVQANFAKNSELLFIEKNLAMSGGPEDVYGCSDTLVSKESPFVYVSNFSRKPITIPAGQILSQGWNPSNWLDKERHFSKKERIAINTHTNLLRSIISLEETTIRKNPFARTAKSEVKSLQDAS